MAGDIKKVISDIWERVESTDSGPLDLERLITVGERIAEALEQLVECQQPLMVSDPPPWADPRPETTFRNLEAPVAYPWDAVRPAPEAPLAVPRLDDPSLWRGIGAAGWVDPAPIRTLTDEQLDRLAIPAPQVQFDGTQYHIYPGGPAINRAEETRVMPAAEVEARYPDSNHTAMTYQQIVDNEDAARERLRRLLVGRGHRAPEDGPEEPDRQTRWRDTDGNWHDSLPDFPDDGGHRP